MQAIMDKLEPKSTRPESARPDDDPTAASRKRDHIEMALGSQVHENQLDRRFYYEPFLAAHPGEKSLPSIPFLGKTLRVPIWVSSMTGGTEWARTINHNLARACREFGMGMGLGSCRSLLFSDVTLNDFDVRAIIGNDLPLFANLGVAQVEQLMENNELHLIDNLLEKLKADGLIIHVNPLQEWLQPEGDHFSKPPIETITAFLEKSERPLIVKEVGQGSGIESLKALLQVPLRAREFAASGGTTFARLEWQRSNPAKQESYNQLAFVGHTAEEMACFANQIINELGDRLRCRQVIISGGIGSFLDGYYLINKVNLPCIYGQASGFLKYARGDYGQLQNYVKEQVEGLSLAAAFLRVK